MNSPVEKNDNSKHAELTATILGCAMEVSNSLGSGFLEAVYQQALFFALFDSGLVVETQKPMTVFYKNRAVGKYFADLLVENKIVLELKAVKSLCPEHFAQLNNYLKVSELEVGLLLNFGNPRLEYHRVVRSQKPFRSEEGSVWKTEGQ